MKSTGRSRKGLLLAILLLVAGGCYKESSYSPTDPQVTGALTLAPADGTLSIPADGVSRLTMVATISADADSDKRVITFTTSSGSFVGAGNGTTVDVTAGSDGRALVILQSSQRVETAIVTAVVKGSANVSAQRQIQFTAPNPDDVLRFVTAPAAAPADGQTITLFKVAVSPSVTTGTVTFSSTAGTFPVATVQIGIDHTATAGLMSSKVPGVGTVSATLNSGGGTGGFSRQIPFRFDVALPNVISVVVDSLTVMPGGKVHVTAHLTRPVGQVTANTVAVFSATDANGNDVGGFENVTVVQPGASDSDSIATADFLPGATAAPGPVTIFVGTEPLSVTGSTTITVVP
ncbi:MAG TPA: hypothetical protein VLB76_04190 [Thermoanaerobaculia bacterium]|jgi:microcompartment protein CcmK/EutM|nr:hypothetical protein [Thermoanaerobaculia bacterium]